MLLQPSPYQLFLHLSCISLSVIMRLLRARPVHASGSESSHPVLSEFLTRNWHTLNHRPQQWRYGPRVHCGLIQQHECGLMQEGECG